MSFGFLSPVLVSSAFCRAKIGLDAADLASASVGCDQFADGRSCSGGRQNAMPQHWKGIVLQWRKRQVVCRVQGGIVLEVLWRVPAIPRGRSIGWMGGFGFNSTSG